MHPRMTIAALVLCALGWTGTAPAAASAPVSRYAVTMAPKLASHTQFTAISFASPLLGWVGGFTLKHGLILRTTDGGKSWSTKETGFDVHQMQFVDAGTGWAIGTAPADCAAAKRKGCHGVIEVTHNGGKSWSQQVDTGPCGRLLSIDFITLTEGWVIRTNSACGAAHTKASVLGTTDAGHTWRPSLRTRELTSIHFGSPSGGWAAANGGTPARCATTIFKTSNSGRSWPREFAVKNYCDSFVDFVDHRHGWLLAVNLASCAMHGCGDYRLYQTGNGGGSWKLEQKVESAGRFWFGSGGTLGQPHFVDDRIGYIPITSTAGGGRGGIDITRDAGAHWSRTRPHSMSVSDVSPVDP